MGGWVNNFWNTFTTNLYALTLDFAEFAPTGSDIFNIVTTGYEGVTWGLNVPPNEQKAWAFTFVGRTAGGHRSRITQFGAQTLGTDYRVISGELAFMTNVLGVLAGSSGVLLGIDNLPIVWKNYADVQVNDHWVKELRP